MNISNLDMRAIVRDCDSTMSFYYEGDRGNLGDWFVDSLLFKQAGRRYERRLMKV